MALIRGTAVGLWGVDIGWPMRRGEKRKTPVRTTHSAAKLDIGWPMHGAGKMEDSKRFAPQD